MAVLPRQIYFINRSSPSRCVHRTVQNAHAVFMHSSRAIQTLDDPKYSQRQLRRTDLGKTLDTLTEMLPNLQHELPPSSLLSPNIQLRLFPKTHPGLPSIRGKTAYLATWRIAQWVLPFFVLGPIDGFVEIADGALAEEDQAKRQTADNSNTMLSNLFGLGRAPADHRKGAIVFKIVSMRLANEDDDIEICDVDDYEPQSATKLYVRWQTSFAPAEPVSGPRTELVTDATEPSVVTGLFTFEFDRDGKILVHSIDDVEEIRTQQTATPKGLKKLARVVGRRGDDRPVVTNDENTHGIPQHISG